MADYISRRNTLKSLVSLTVMGAASGCGPTATRPAAIAVSRAPSQAGQDTVSTWTNTLLDVVRRTSANPPQATRAFAMGHLAGFLAVNGLTQTYPTRHNIGAGPTTANPNIAYAMAFSRAASAATGANLSAQSRQFVDQFPNSDAKTQAVSWGERVGSYVAGTRRQDGSGPAAHAIDSFRYPKQGGVMSWVPTGNHHGARGTVRIQANARPLLPSWGKLRPFSISSARAFRPERFPAANSAEFARQFHKVKQIGRFQGANRSADQTQIAMFWEDGPGGVTPPGHWQIIALRVLRPMGLDLTTFAHHMALFSMAQADAGVVAWDSKYHYDIIRPITAIRTHGNSYPNAQMAGGLDTNWRSLIPSPPFPAYVSGHSAFAGASARMLANVIGTDSVRFSGPAADPDLWPSDLRGVQRSWSSIWQAAQECGDSREFGGVHWEHDNTQGLRAGLRIADSVFSNRFT